MNLLLASGDYQTKGETVSENKYLGMCASHGETVFECSNCFSVHLMNFLYDCVKCRNLNLKLSPIRN
jgi:hypothetical protein